MRTGQVVTKIPVAGSAPEAALALQIRLDKLPPPITEYLFAAPRKWRADFAWPDLMFIVEVEGLTPGGGRHQRMQGFEKDLEKYEAALLKGYTLYRCSPAMIKSGTAIETIKTMLARLSGAGSGGR